MEILSAPSRNIALKSSTVRIPPPTVNGINTFSEKEEKPSYNTDVDNDDIPIFLRERSF